MPDKTFTAALRLHLTADTTLAGLVGSKIYHLRATTRTSDPYIIFQLISTEDYRGLQSHQGIVEERWQFDIYGQTDDTVEAIGKALFNALDHKLSQTWSNYTVLAVLREGASVNWSSLGDGSEDGWTSKTQDFKIIRQITPKATT